MFVVVGVDVVVVVGTVVVGSVAVVVVVVVYMVVVVGIIMVILSDIQTWPAVPVFEEVSPIQHVWRSVIAI